MVCDRPVVAFVAGIALMAASGVQVLIPETGKDGLDWIADVDDASGAFFIGAWLVIVGGILGLVGLIGFYDALRRGRDWLVLAPILGVFGLTLVTISHLLPIAMAYELVPDFRAASMRTPSTPGLPRPGSELHRRRGALGSRRHRCTPSRS